MYYLLSVATNYRLSLLYTSKNQLELVDSVFINYLHNIQTNIKYNPHLAAITQFTDLVSVLTAPPLNIDTSACTDPTLPTEPCTALC